jgi:hypothetical protein
MLVEEYVIPRGYKKALLVEYIDFENISRFKTSYILSLAIQCVVAYYKPTVIQIYTKGDTK